MPRAPRQGLDAEDVGQGTRLKQGNRLLTQNGFAKALLANRGADVLQLFDFRKPRSGLAPTTRKNASQKLVLTLQQHAVMFALAGCIDVVNVMRNVTAEVRKVIHDEFGIDKKDFHLWFKNRAPVTKRKNQGLQAMEEAPAEIPAEGDSGSQGQPEASASISGGTSTASQLLVRSNSQQRANAVANATAMEGAAVANAAMDMDMYGEAAPNSTAGIYKEAAPNTAAGIYREAAFNTAAGMYRDANPNAATGMYRVAAATTSFQAAPCNARTFVQAAAPYTAVVVMDAAALNTASGVYREAAPTTASEMYRGVATGMHRGAATAITAPGIFETEAGPDMVVIDAAVPSLTAGDLEHLFTPGGQLPPRLQQQLQQREKEHRLGAATSRPARRALTLEAAVEQFHALTFHSGMSGIQFMLSYAQPSASADSSNDGSSAANGAAGGSSGHPQPPASPTLETLVQVMRSRAFAPLGVAWPSPCSLAAAPCHLPSNVSALSC